MPETTIAHETIQLGDCIEIKFTGFVDGKPFDSNVAEDLKKVNEKATPERTILFVGKKMVVPGLDNSFVGKKLNTEYKIKLSAIEGFGPRRTELVKTIPLKVFIEQRVQPRPGAAFILDNQLARIIAVSGARVITDFNNPLSGKELEYRFTILSKVTDLKDRTEAACKLLLRFVPELSVSGTEVTLKGPKVLETFIQRNQDNFKQLIGYPILFQTVEVPKEKAVEA
ncbi:MAG: FKBP-type peptidyl-prolyl cis-trans isomerase [Candidatus Pacearchaeota archaeon]